VFVVSRAPRVKQGKGRHCQQQQQEQQGEKAILLLLGVVSSAQGMVGVPCMAAAAAMRVWRQSWE
jgi:hypothetical protein